MSIPFTQYLRPNGRRTQVLIERSPAIEALAEKVIASGGRFECEELRTGHASLTVAYQDDDIAIELVPNGPQVPDAVDRLVRKAADRLGLF